DRGLWSLEHVAPVAERDDRPGRHQVGLGALSGAALARLALTNRRVDHRVAFLPLLRGLTLALGRLDQPRLDAELAEAQPLVGLEFDLRACQQVIAPPPCVLQEVAGELLLERALIAL